MGMMGRPGLHSAQLLPSAVERPCILEREPVLDPTTAEFTGKERDQETGLDYFDARYFSSAQGRFTSPDEFKGGIVDAFTGLDIETNTALPYADITDPQTLNKYSYVRNNPLRYTDPDGHEGEEAVDPAVEEVDQATVDRVAQPLIESAGEAGTQGAGSAVAGAVARGAGLVLGLLAFPAQLGGSDEVKFEKEQQQRQQQYEQQQQQQQQNPGQVQPATPSPQNAEHTQHQTKFHKDKHEKKDPGTSPPPNYKPDRKFKQDKHDKKKDRVKPPYHRKDRDK